MPTCAAHYLNDLNSVACCNRSIILGMSVFDSHILLQDISGALIIFAMELEINRLLSTSCQVEHHFGD